MKAKLNTNVVFIRDFYKSNMSYRLEREAIGDAFQATICAPNNQEWGFGIETMVRGVATIAGYFSEIREGEESAPKYESSMYLTIAGKAYCLTDGSCKLRWKVGLFNRFLEIHQISGDEFIHAYKWSFYKQLFARIFSDPFNFISNDFFEEFIKVAKFYHPQIFT